MDANRSTQTLFSHLLNSFPLHSLLLHNQWKLLFTLSVLVCVLVAGRFNICPFFSFLFYPSYRNFCSSMRFFVKTGDNRPMLTRDQRPETRDQGPRNVNRRPETIGIRFMPVFDFVFRFIAVIAFCPFLLLLLFWLRLLLPFFVYKTFDTIQLYELLHLNNFQW